MNENMIMARFENLDDAKEVYDVLKASTKRSIADFEVLQVVLIRKNEEGRIHVLDQKSEVFTEVGKTMIGGVAGIVLGVMIGPFAGFLLGGIGAIIGSGFDISTQTENESMLYQMYSRIHNGDIVILAIVQEHNELIFNSFVGKKAVEICRWDAAEIREEAEYTDEMQNTLVSKAKALFKGEKDERRRYKIKEYKNRLKADFEKEKSEKEEKSEERKEEREEKREEKLVEKAEKKEEKEEKKDKKKKKKKDKKKNKNKKEQ